MLAVESTPSNSYKSKSLQFILLIIIITFKWKTQPLLKRRHNYCIDRNFLCLFPTAWTRWNKFPFRCDGALF